MGLNTELFIQPHTRLLFSHLSLSRCYALITDEHVAALYGNALACMLCEAGFDVSLFSLKAGEVSKTREAKHALEDAMLAKGLGKQTTVIALGGGVITDIAGFTAATYCRGLPLISLPTTLLAMVDACIGGKTGVNTKEGKNLIGAYHPASLICIDLSFLETLSEKEMQNGYAEMIKYGLIASLPLFELLEKRDSAILAEGIQQSIGIKKETIESDFFEKGVRRMLNFGHTFGHAYEVLSHYAMPHGQAVALGMACESFLSMRLGFLKMQEYERIIGILEVYGFSLHIPRDVAFDALVQAMRRDKKASSMKPRFVILETIGSVKAFEGEYCCIVEGELLQEVYDHFSR